MFQMALEKGNKEVVEYLVSVFQTIDYAGNSLALLRYHRTVLQNLSSKIFPTNINVFYVKSVRFF